MVDDCSHAGDDDGRRPQELFFARALEAVLRLVELYAAERNIQTYPDPVHRAEPLGGVANANPDCRVDESTAASPSASVTLSEPPGKIEQSGPEGSLPGHEAVSRVDPARKSPRGGWTKGNSTSAQIRAGAVEYLLQKGGRAGGREIWEALKAKGMIINAKDPSALVSSRIGRSPLFDHTYAGYGLREWSDGGSRRSNG